MNKAIASIFGIGFIKGGGTLAAAVCCLFIYFTAGYQLTVTPSTAFFIALAILLVGIYTGNQVEPFWGKDSSKVVIDEVAGMWISVLLVPVTWYYLLAGFVLFRFFDIVKPLYIRRMEKLPGGAGVMMDDVLAGVYSNIVLQIIVLLVRAVQG